MTAPARVGTTNVGNLGEICAGNHECRKLGGTTNVGSRGVRIKTVDAHEGGCWNGCILGFCGGMGDGLGRLGVA